ncbi:ATP-binding protein [Nucisporomicrobium flavum]|uniref:ATP-binding protein n=1 Tax=Nucisporomicrobium flavum TaxID=2785915 RepID=UPI003C3028AC
MTALERLGPLPATTGAPYLVTTGVDRRAVAVEVTADASVTVVEMTVHGRWSEQLGGQVADAVRLCLAGPTRAIIIDLRDVGDLHGSSLPFWAAAARSARLAPIPARLALCLPPGTMLDHRLRHTEAGVPRAFPTMAEARIVLAGPLVRTHRRMQGRLPAHPRSVRAARDLVARACQAWQLNRIRHDAALVMSELAANAVEHAGTDAVATVVGDGSRLHLAVRDGDTRYPRFTERKSGQLGRSLGERGRGLRLVHAVAVAWGAMPARGGKVVWATVSPQTGPALGAGLDSREPGDAGPPGGVPTGTG